MTAEELGGASTHEPQVFRRRPAPLKTMWRPWPQVRRLVDFLPLNNREKPPVRPFFDQPGRIEESLGHPDPGKPQPAPYDMKELITKVADEGDFFEIQEDFAGNIITGFIRL